MVVDFDLSVYYSGDSFVVGRCHRFDIQNYSLIFEIWLKKSDLLAIQNNTRPGAVKELKRVVYAPKFYDSTWSGKNTLKLRPTVGSSLYNMRGSERIIYPKSISSSPESGPPGSNWINLKVEGYLSGSTL